MQSLDKQFINELEEKAKKLRKDVLDLAVKTGEAHLGGALSEIEILLSLYSYILKPEDKFILSKGHSCFPYYLLLREKGYNPTISGHPDIDEQHGIYCTSGSLGHGLPLAAGIAFAKKLKEESGQIYVLLGDGECQEGTIWETSLIASKYKLNNLTAIIDYNRIQGSECIEKVLPLPQNLKVTFENLGWNTLEVNGHDFKEIISALNERSAENPKMIIANTIKGKGISFMENNPKWHGGVPKGEELDKAYEELK